MKSGTIPADNPMRVARNLRKILNAGTQEQSLQIKMTPAMDSRLSHVIETEVDPLSRPKACKWWAGSGEGWR